AQGPGKSSTAGRGLPSLQSRPAGTKPRAGAPARARNAAATGLALRRHPVKTAPAPPARDSREPLGDGSKGLAPLAMPARLGGDRLKRLPPAFPRGSAKMAPASTAAARAAVRSPSGNGTTEAPRATATSTAV